MKFLHKKEQAPNRQISDMSDVDVSSPFLVVCATDIVRRLCANSGELTKRCDFHFRN